MRLLCSPTLLAVLILPACGSSQPRAQPPVQMAAKAQGGECYPLTHYWSEDGHCVLRPIDTGTGDNDPPPGATARCEDGAYSFSHTPRGTCSYHGGVDKWLVSKAELAAR